MYCLPGSQHEGHELHRQEHDGVRGSGGGDHRHPPHHAVQRQEGRQLLHPAQGNNGFETRLGFYFQNLLSELLQPYQPEGSGGGALPHPVPVRRPPAHRAAQQLVTQCGTNFNILNNFEFCYLRTIRMFQRLLNCLGPFEGRHSVKAVFSKSKYYYSYFNNKLNML